MAPADALLGETPASYRDRARASFAAMGAASPRIVYMGPDALGRPGAEVRMDGPTGPLVASALGWPSAQHLAREIRALEYARAPLALRVQPGDTLVFKTPGFMSEAAAAELKATVDTLFPGHRVLVIEGDLDLIGTVGPAAEGAPDA